MSEPLPAELITTPDLAVRVTAVLPAEPAAVWPWLVDPARTQRWSPIVPERTLDCVGPALSREEPEQDPVACDVLAVEPPRLLEHRWGPDRVVWTLDPAGEGTTLGVEQHTSTREMAASLAAGWTMCLDVLGRLLRGEDAARVVGPAALEHGWAELDAHYRREFGADAAQPGASE